MTAAELDAYMAEGAKGAHSDGHGIGLAVCRRLASEHGMALEAVSVPGRGSTFP